MHFQSSKENFSYILRQNIWRHCHILESFFFTTNKMKLDYYHQKNNVQVATRVGEPLKTYNLITFQENP